MKDKFVVGLVPVRDIYPGNDGSEACLDGSEVEVASLEAVGDVVVDAGGLDGPAQVPLGGEGILHCQPLRLPLLVIAG